jgi:hypothetical protein
MHPLPTTFATDLDVRAAAPFLAQHDAPGGTDRPIGTPMTQPTAATTLTLAAGFLAVLAVGFFTGFANTWPVVAVVLVGTYLLGRR